MSILPSLYKAYEKEGFSLLSGLLPARHGGVKEAAFTWLLRGGKSVTDGYGISLNEVQTLEAILPATKAKNIFIIGNSFGFSTLAIALICPAATVVTIDAGVDAHSKPGLKLTEKMARHLGLKNVKALLATSPEDVPSVVKKYLGGKVDVAFIDGLHTNEQIAKDAQALVPFLTPTATLIFHDVLEFGLQPGLAHAITHTQTQAHILHTTTSGMAVLTRGKNPALAEALIPYCPKEEFLHIPTSMQTWKKESRSMVKRLVRSLKKRLGVKLPPKSSFHTGDFPSTF